MQERLNSEFAEVLSRFEVKRLSGLDAAEVLGTSGITQTILNLIISP
jgi:hypothetical protein